MCIRDRQWRFVLWYHIIISPWSTFNSYSIHFFGLYLLYMWVFALILCYFFLLLLYLFILGFGFFLQEHSFFLFLHWCLLFFWFLIIVFSSSSSGCHRVFGFLLHLLFLFHTTDFLLFVVFSYFLGIFLVYSLPSLWV